MLNLKDNGNPNMWMIRAGSDGFLINYFLQHNIVAVGWDVEDLSDKTKSEIRNMIEARYDYKKPAILTRYTNQLVTFVNTIKVGDYVLTHDKSTQVYYLGKFTSNYYYKDIIHRTHPTYDGGFYNHVRNVNWFAKFNKDSIEEHNRRSLNNFLSIFKINDELKQNILYISSELEEKDYSEIENLKLYKTQLDGEDDYCIVIELNKDVNQGLLSLVKILNDENINLDYIYAYTNNAEYSTFMLYSKDMDCLEECLIDNFTKI